MMEKRDFLTSPLQPGATKLMLLGCGELGKEVAIEAKRLGFEVIGVDRYANAPGQQVADRAYSGDMTNADFLRKLVEKEKPDALIPEIEAINLDLLFDLEKEGWNVVPNARATHAAMQRERIRKVISEEAGVKTSKFGYAESLDEMKEVCEKVGYPCWVKAIMSSSGHGSYFVKGPEDIKKAYGIAASEGRVKGTRVIVEEHIDFDIEVTELVVRHRDENGKIKTSFPKPVGHYQIDGDYHSSWQPAEVSEKAEKKIYEAAKKITNALGGLGLFGCELFVKGDEVYGNEISPRPHDTGMVTFVTHQTGFSQAGLHVRAITGLPIPTVDWQGFSTIPMLRQGASHVLLSPVEGKAVKLCDVYNATNTAGTTLFFFGKPEAHKHRRMGVVLATDNDVQKAKEKAQRVAHEITMCSKEHSKCEKQDEMRKHLEL